MRTGTAKPLGNCMGSTFWDGPKTVRICREDVS